MSATAPVVIRHEGPARGPSPTNLASYGSSPASSLPPFSPPSAYVYPGSLGVAGASPPYRGGSSAAADKSNPYLAAKKFWKRLCFDPALDPTEYTIGFIETVQQPERKSGVEAWSMRLHDRLLELPFDLFVERFCGGGGGGAAGDAGTGADGGAALPPRHAASSSSPAGGALSGGGHWSQQSTSEESGSDVPYHRIAYFKHGKIIVWESEHHKRRLNELQAASPAPFLYGAVPSGPSDGGGSSAPAADRSRSHRRNSRDGMPPMPPGSPANPGALYGSTPPSRFGSLLGASGGGAGIGLGPGLGASSGGMSARGLRGTSVQGSDDGLDGASSDDGDMLLLEEEEQEQEDDEDEAAGAPEMDDGDTDADPAGLSSDEGRRVAAAVARVLRGTPGVAAGPFAGAGAPAEAPPPLPQLPEECWMDMLRLLGVREVCMVGRTCRWLRQLASDPAVWRAQYESLWGTPPEPQLTAPVVRRLCRRSQLRAARWLEASVRGAAMGFPSTTCLQLDDSKVVSADGNAVRLWSHATGRRIATLQGHPGRVTCAAFDEALLISGCAGAVVKLWDMDELRCKRTLRGHEGPVTACCLLANGIPASGAEDGLMRLWDVNTGSSIVALEAGHPVLAMQAHGPSGHLVSAAGWGVQLWDVSTATLLQTLGSAADDDFTGAGAGASTASSQHPYTCVSYMGDLLAAGRQGEVVLMDPRVSRPVGRLRCDVRRGSGGDGGGGGLGAIAAAAGGGGGAAGGSRDASCVGVQMDEWKLVCGFNDGRHQLSVYDIRAVPKASAAGGGGGGGGGGGAGGGAARRSDGSGRRAGWHEPLMTLKAPARINAFQFHEQALLVGLEGTECIMWRFENPNVAAAAAAGAVTGGASPGPRGGPRPGGAAGAYGPAAGGGGGGGGSGAVDGQGFIEAAGGGRKEKKKPAKVAKKQTRYPKRNTK